MSINKVIYGDQTLIDITDTDATATTVQSGKKFYNAAGNLVVGTGSALGHETELLSNGGTAHYINGIDLGSDTVDASHLATGYTAHDSTGASIVGTMAGGALKFGVLRPDAELIETVTFDKLWVTNESGTIPAYSTSAAVLEASAVLTTQYTLDLANYNYIVLYRTLTYPIYNNATIAAGRQDWHGYALGYEINSIVANTLKSFSSVNYTSRYNSTSNIGAITRGVYYSSATAIKVMTGSYGVYQTTPSTPSLSSTSSNTPTLKIYSPVFGIRGSATYLNSTYWEYITDIRRQYRMELYRSPVSSSSETDGWTALHQVKRIATSVSTTNHNLT